MKTFLFYTTLFTLIIAKNTFGQCFLTRISGNMIWDQTSGNIDLDNILSSQKKDLESFFGLNINLYYGTELDQQGNAFFTPNCYSFNCNGEIVLGKYLMSELSTKSFSYARLVAVFAHEFAHGMQHKYGWSGNSKWRELHADYLAGYYLGRSNSLTESQVISIFNEFYSRGDYGFNDPSHHGTPDERSCAFLEGFKFAYTGSTTVYDAYNSGKRYIFANNPCNRYSPQRVSALDIIYLFGAAPEATILVGGIVLFGSVFLLSNDFYLHPTYAFHFNKKSNPFKYKNGFGWSYGLRKQFNRSALEYGITSVSFKPKLGDATYNYGEKQLLYFNLNYIHNFNFSYIPKRIQPYAGAGVNIGDGIGFTGIIGAYMPVIDRLSVDFRYEVGNRTNQVHFGLIFKYQKEYLWHKKKQR